MKITIDLNEAEVKALKAYLKEVSHDLDHWEIITDNISSDNNRGLGLGDHSNTSDNGYEDA